MQELICRLNSNAWRLIMRRYLLAVMMSALLLASTKAMAASIIMYTDTGTLTDGEYMVFEHVVKQNGYWGATPWSHLIVPEDGFYLIQYKNEDDGETNGTVRADVQVKPSGGEYFGTADGDNWQSMMEDSVGSGKSIHHLGTWMVYLYRNDELRIFVTQDAGVAYVGARLAVSRIDAASVGTPAQPE